MNRGLLFYAPSTREWIEYNRNVLGRKDYHSLAEGDDGESPSGAYLLASYTPAIALSLTRPDLAWCVDGGPPSRHETKLQIGSGYFVMEKCVLGPSVHYADAAADGRVTMFAQTFASDVSEGLRWILLVYGTANILQQHELFDAGLAVAKNMRNRHAYENYTPVRLVAEVSDANTCEDMRTEATDQQFYRQQFGYTSGVAAPVGDLGQFSRPHLGAAPIGGLCTADADNLAVRDPYVVTAEELRDLKALIAENREQMAASHFASIFRPVSGMTAAAASTGPGRPTASSSSSAQACGRRGAGDGGGSCNAAAAATVHPATPVPMPPTLSRAAEDVTMEDVEGGAALMGQFLG